ncbi:GNAT family N-acetyltransferase [Bacillus sp. PS06]|uniref:GNAT family N-acetyltransferase n=1 Tax=Bacillus sp. PS06 TaxID=2764176 RepID=UPI001786EF12|nr:GNAT family N-acetyltransferase [Bacillus sp. PS06]MBD8069015.1 N-acetyltransferase [Bacillus sp. PS06]
MLNQYSIRDAAREDLPMIVEIYNSTIASRMVTADLEPVTVSDREVWFSNHSPEFRPLWVVELDGRICAWVSFEKFYGRPAYNQTAELSIYIHNDYRGKGLGKDLLKHAIHACPDLNIKTLLAFIFGHNLPSIKLFEHFGFTQMALLPKVAVLDGVERDLVIVGLRIND